MATALWFGFAAIAALLAILLVVLATPLKVRFAVRSFPSWRLEVAVRLVGGRTPELLVHDSARPKRARKRRLEARERFTLSRRTAPRMMRAIAASPRLLADMFRAVRIEWLAVDADLGLDDPADTGQLFGLLSVIARSRPPGSKLSLVIRPDFTGPRASGAVDAQFSLVPASLIPAGARFAWRVFRPAR